MSGENWSRDEVEATVADYFSMLREELAGRVVNKARHNEGLRNQLRGRSKGSVEFKHANISAVLNLHDYPYIDGYKPRFNFQALLEQVVLEYLEVHRDFFDPFLNGPVLNPTVTPMPDEDSLTEIIVNPPERMPIPTQRGAQLVAWPVSILSRGMQPIEPLVVTVRSLSSNSNVADYATPDALSFPGVLSGLRKRGETGLGTISIPSMTTRHLDS